MSDLIAETEIYAISIFQHLYAKDSLQPSEEKVGAFTRIMEAMGFTGPLKYSRWVKQKFNNSFGCLVVLKSRPRTPHIFFLL